MIIQRGSKNFVMWEWYAYGKLKKKKRWCKRQNLKQDFPFTLDC